MAPFSSDGIIIPYHPFLRGVKPYFANHNTTPHVEGWGFNSRSLVCWIRKWPWHEGKGKGKFDPKGFPGKPGKCFHRSDLQHHLPTLLLISAINIRILRVLLEYRITLMQLHSLWDRNCWNRQTVLDVKNKEGKQTQSTIEWSLNRSLRISIEFLKRRVNKCWRYTQRISLFLPAFLSLRDKTRESKIKIQIRKEAWNREIHAQINRLAGNFQVFTTSCLVYARCTERVRSND